MIRAGVFRAPVGLKLDGSNPTLLYGYGEFNVVNADRRRARSAETARLRVRRGVAQRPERCGASRTYPMTSSPSPSG